MENWIWLIIFFVGYIVARLLFPTIEYLLRFKGGYKISLKTKTLDDMVRALEVTLKKFKEMNKEE